MAVPIGGLSFVQVGLGVFVKSVIAVGVCVVGSLVKGVTENF